jgi:hypothetical protein
MALDYMAIASYGVFPTPTPTSAVRAYLASSMGLLSSLSESDGIISKVLRIGKTGIGLANGLLKIG